MYGQQESILECLRTFLAVLLKFVTLSLGGMGDTSGAVSGFMWYTKVSHNGGMEDHCQMRSGLAAPPKKCPA